MKYTTLLACLLGCAATVAAQAAPIAILRGTITDPIHHRAVAGAQVELHTGVHVLRVRTDRAGRFAFAGVSAGRVDLTLAAAGYSPVTISTCAEPSETRTLPLYIVPTLHGMVSAPVAKRYYDRANLHDATVAQGPHFSVTTDQHTLGYCGG